MRSPDLYLGDCLFWLTMLPDNSVDAVVTDPPYGLSFMGKKWDYDVPGEAIWRECLRVLKPGGHLLAFAGTRTQHRMAVRIEDAGFEIRDMIAWVYGSGFPKSLDVSKAIDKAAGAEREKVRVKPRADTSGTMVGASDTRPWIEKSREVGYHEVAGDVPVTEAARQWQGWGTALKPSHETVTWATKPFPPERERARILANLWKIEARLWLLSSASAAAQSSTSSQSEYVAACATAQWTADDATNTRAALRGLMDTWQCEMATHTSLSIVSSWRRTLEESSKPGSTSTIATESSTTTDWRTLSCCLSEITPESIIQACSLPGGFNANASTAAQIFNASLALLQSTLTLSAIEPATWQELGARQGEDVRPSLDPVIMARKPLIGTVAENVLAHGTGALNIDGCRVETTDNLNGGTYSGRPNPTTSDGWRMANASREFVQPEGRWPANLIHDGSDEVVVRFPDSNGSGSARTLRRGQRDDGWGMADQSGELRDAGTGSAARFFYCAKASKRDRDEGLDGFGKDTTDDGRNTPIDNPYLRGKTERANVHPTVKPTDLMRYLCRLVTRPVAPCLTRSWVAAARVKRQHSKASTSSAWSVTPTTSPSPKRGLTMLEKQIETKVCDYAKQRGLLVYKFTSPARAAVPDRLFVLPNGRMFFCEFKRQGQKPTIPQEREHNRLRGHKVNVFVVDNVQAGVRMIDEMVGLC